MNNLEKIDKVKQLRSQGKTVEEILESFKDEPDYNHKIYKYNIEYLLGLKGNKK